MTTVNILTDTGSDILRFLTGVMSSVDRITHSSTHVTFIDAHHRIILTGIGLTFDGSGDVTGGTISQMHFRSGATDIAKATGFSIDAVTFLDALKSGTPGDALAQLGDFQFNGNDGPDVEVTANGHDTLSGGIGDDVLTGGGGGDILVGGAGIDAASYVTALVGVHANLSSFPNNSGDASGDTYSGIENLIGSRFADSLTGDGNDNTLIGDKGRDVLSGLDGEDTIIGGAGADRIIGGKGIDILSGGAGADKFIFDSTPANFDGDIIGGWQGIDSIVVSASAFGGGLVAHTALTNSQFHVGDASIGTNGQFYYSTVGNGLFWDADGTGSGGAIIICVFGDGVVLSKDDIQVV